MRKLALVRTGFPFDSRNFSEEGKFLVITNGNIQDDSPNVNSTIGNRITVTKSLSDEYCLNHKDILVTMDGTVGKTAKVADEGLILAQRVGRLTAYGNRDFLYQMLNSGSFSDEMISLSRGGTIKHISLEEINNFTCLVPPCEIEQNAIGGLFRGLDNLITLHQCKYSDLKL